jgi:hypothetical protein
MSWLYNDMSTDKQECVQLLETINAAPESERQTVGAMVLLQLNQISHRWIIDHGKFMMLMKSQVMSGNPEGAIRVIEALPSRRLKLFPLVVVSILLWPFRLVGKLIGLGFK